MLPPDFFQNIPQISTRRALLVLDLQNDFVSPDGALFVPNTPEFLARIPDLASHFRSSGKVIWVQTLFTRPRDIFSPAAGGDVALVSSDSSSDPEAFLAEHQQHANPCCSRTPPAPSSPPPSSPPSTPAPTPSSSSLTTPPSSPPTSSSPFAPSSSPRSTSAAPCPTSLSTQPPSTPDARRCMTELLGVYTVNSAELLREGEGEGEMGPLRPDLPAETTTTTTTKEGIAPSQTIELYAAEKTGFLSIRIKPRHRRGSSICNVSLGAQRVMTLRTKASATPRSESGDAGRQSQRVPLPHNSLFILGETSNMKWLHGIRQDKRPESTKGPEELAFNGERISLTFRHIGTFINPELDTIWGQGARSKTQDNAGKIIHGEASETERLIHAFGQENQQTVFDWDAHYGEGFDVVNFVTVTNSAKVVLTGDEVSNLQVLLCLVENGIRYDVLQSASDLPPSVRETLDPSPGDDVPIYLDSDDKTCISGSINILTHIGTHRRAQDTPDPSIPINDSGPQDRLERAGKLLDAWRTIVSRPPSPSTEDLLVSLEPLTPHLDFVASFLPAGQTYISAPITFGIDDCAFWPVLRSIALDDKGKMLLDRYPALVGYYWKVGRRACVKSVLEEMKARV
ncbi:isochorismatase family protein [Coccidioides immitis RMSCC 3703]|uniref:Isochorismatase family protein n=1 Tax=Coccidioides immitis RMSCC 3703 TaxID=454286 RepID=A0A0J8R8Q9_COCIT|nr:isochorismatase family protein [Coccidioides immitis RMSCC 3703]